MKRSTFLLLFTCILVFPLEAVFCQVGWKTSAGISLHPACVGIGSISGSDLPKPIATLHIANGEFFLPKFRAYNDLGIQNDNLGVMITSRNQGERSTSLIGITSGKSQTNIGISASAINALERNYAFMALAQGEKAMNIGLMAKAEGGMNNVAVEGESVGFGPDMINVGIVGKVAKYEDEPGYNMGILGKAFGHGSNDEKAWNTAIEGRACGKNNTNVAVSAFIGADRTHDTDILIETENSTNYGFQANVKAESSTNYGAYLHVEGINGRNTALYAEAIGGRKNIAAELKGDVVVEGQLYIVEDDKKVIRRHPELFTETSNGQPAMDITELIPYLIEKIDQQEEKIKDLEQKLNDLKKVNK